MELNPDNPSSAAFLGTIEDAINREDLLIAFRAASLVDRAQQISDRISSPEAYKEYTGFAVLDAFKVANNAFLLGINQVRNARARHYIGRAEQQLGMTIPTSVYKNVETTDKQG